MGNGGLSGVIEAIDIYLHDLNFASTVSETALAMGLAALSALTEA